MSEAFLVGNNGVRFKRLRVPVLPDKTTYLYFNGTFYDDVDLTGAKIVADIGRSEVTLTPDNYTYEMNILSDTAAEFLVEATIGSTTKRASIPIVLLTPDPILDNNSWRMISIVSAAGLAGEIWNIGDIKTETINGTLKSFRIIGFDHDYLDSSDSRYSDSSYNQDAYADGKRYAGITFQTTEEWGEEKMNMSATNVGGWKTCLMRTNVMPAVYESFTDDMKAVIRTVNKRTAVYLGSNNRDNMVDCADEVFILAAKELVDSNTSAPTIENTELSQYEYYANGNPLPHDETQPEWLRSTHKAESCSSHEHFLYVKSGDRVEYTNANIYYDYYPAFCV